MDCPVQVGMLCWLRVSNTSRAIVEIMDCCPFPSPYQGWQHHVRYRSPLPTNSDPQSWKEIWDEDRLVLLSPLELLALAAAT